MEQYLTENDIAVFLGQDIPETRRALKNSRVKSISRQGHIVYNREDVMNWIAEEFSSLTTEKLFRAEVSSAQSKGLDPRACCITELLAGGRISFPRRASTKPSILRGLSLLAVEHGAVYDADELRQELEKREDVVTTALKCGAALVHPLEIRRLYVEHELLLMMIPPHPVPFGEISGRLTSLFFLLLFPDPHRHVHVLARLNRLLRSDSFIESILVSESDAEAITVMRERELEVIDTGTKA